MHSLEVVGLKTIRVLALEVPHPRNLSVLGTPGPLAMLALSKASAPLLSPLDPLLGWCPLGSGPSWAPFPHLPDASSSGSSLLFPCSLAPVSWLSLLFSPTCPLPAGRVWVMLGAPGLPLTRSSSPRLHLHQGLRHLCCWLSRGILENSCLKEGRWSEPPLPAQMAGRDCPGPPGELMESTADKGGRSSGGQSGVGGGLLANSALPVRAFWGGAQCSLGSWSIHIDSGNHWFSKAGHPSSRGLGTVPGSSLTPPPPSSPHLSVGSAPPQPSLDLCPPYHPHLCWCSGLTDFVPFNYQIFSAPWASHSHWEQSATSKADFKALLSSVNLPQVASPSLRTSVCLRPPHCR